MEKKMKETTVSQQEILKTGFAQIRLDDILDSYGNPGKRLVLVHPGGVGILAVKDQKILLVKQYRYAVGDAILEIPAGKLEIGEDPLSCGKRELIEETGFKAQTFFSLGSMFPSPGYTSERIYLYGAYDLSFVGQNLDEGEYVEPIWMDLDEAVKKIISGEIADAKTQIAIFRYLQIQNK